MAGYSMLAGAALARADCSTGRLQILAWLLSGKSTSTCRGRGLLDSSDDALLAPGLALLPPGAAFEAPPGTLLHAVVDALARDPARVERQIDELGRQIVPGVVGGLLADWEEAAGLSGDEEALDAAEAAEVQAEVLAAGSSVPDYQPLPLRRADAVAARLAPSAPCSISEFEARLRQCVLLRRMTNTTPPAQEIIGFSVIEISRHLPMRAGEGCVGDALWGDDWQFRWDVTLEAAGIDGTLSEVAARVRARCRPLLDWLERSWPPWCALRMDVRQPEDPATEMVFSINLEQ